jgi:uncharacterized membrane protein
MPDAPTTAGNKNTTMAVIAYILFFVPLLTGDAKKDAFVKYHTKQGLVLFILAAIVQAIVWAMPFHIWWSFGWIINLVSLGELVLLILGIINAVNGKQEPLPLIGQFADNFKF